MQKVSVYIKKVKKWNLYFKQIIWPGAGHLFEKEKNILKEPNTPEYALVLVVTWVTLDFDMPYYHPCEDCIENKEHQTSD